MFGTVIDDLVTLDRGVKYWMLLESFTDGNCKEWKE
jgi:hypothetical protein